MAMQALALVQLLVPLTASLQALLSAKDLRSPLLLRVMLRPAVVLVAPLLSGSFLAGAGLIGRPVTAAGQVYGIVVGCIVSVGRTEGLADCAWGSMAEAAGVCSSGCRCRPGCGQTLLPKHSKCTQLCVAGDTATLLLPTGTDDPCLSCFPCCCRAMLRYPLSLPSPVPPLSSRSC